MTILVTGGAGYVGSIVAEELLKAGYEVIVLDNLQQGHRVAVAPGARFLIGDLLDPQCLEEVFQREKVDAVMHMAAETVVEFSMTDPRRHFQNNVVGGMNLLEAMLRHNVRKFIFSSSAAVYGEPGTTSVEEEHAKAPVNAYGESKLMFERILDWYGRAYGLKHISLRYFNAAGASESLGEDHRPETHLIPNVLKTALGKGGPFPIFGTDYLTEDGSCVRDYIHVVDIAKAHVLVLQKLEMLGGRVYNLGNGLGYSVLQVVEAARRVTGLDIPTTGRPRRAGDPAVLVASAERARKDLNWRPERDELDDIIESAWKWTRKHPDGYGA